MIAASKSGLSVNIEKTPVPPQVRTSAKTLKPSLEHHTSFDAAIKGGLKAFQYVFSCISCEYDL